MSIPVTNSEVTNLDDLQPFLPEGLSQTASTVINAFHVELFGPYTLSLTEQRNWKHNGASKVKELPFLADLLTSGKSITEFGPTSGTNFKRGDHILSLHADSQDSNTSVFLISFIEAGVGHDASESPHVPLPYYRLTDLTASVIVGDKGEIGDYYHITHTDTPSGYQLSPPLFAVVVNKETADTFTAIWQAEAEKDI